MQGCSSAVTPIGSRGPSGDEEEFRELTDIVLSLVMLAAFALVAGAFALWRRTGEKEKPALMVVLAIIAVGNVLIWTLPDAEGRSLSDQSEAQR